MKKLLDRTPLYVAPDTWLDPEDRVTVEREIVVALRSGELAFQDRNTFASVGESLQEWRARRRRNPRRVSR